MSAIRTAKAETVKLYSAAKNALADLEGIMPEFDASGDRTHPAWKTMKELQEAIDDLEKPYATIGQLPENYTLVQDEAGIEALRAVVNDEEGEYNAFFVLTDEGDYSEIYGTHDAKCLLISPVIKLR